MSTLRFVFDDGGRTEAGFKGHAGDCVTRAIAIATGSDYRWVYDELGAGMEGEHTNRGSKPSGRTARNGVFKSVYQPFLERELGWVWTPTMRFGSGCTVHLRAGEVPMDRPIITRITRHLTAVMYGRMHDIYDPSRNGTRCVYGYWQSADSLRELGPWEAR